MSIDRRGEEDTKEGVGCRMKVRVRLGLASCDEERIRAISSSALPRLMRDRPGSNRGSFGSRYGRLADESRHEKYPLSSTSVCDRLRFSPRAKDGNSRSDGGDGVDRISGKTGGEEAISCSGDDAFVARGGGMTFSSPSADEGASEAGMVASEEGSFG